MVTFRERLNKNILGDSISFINPMIYLVMNSVSISFSPFALALLIRTIKSHLAMRYEYLCNSLTESQECKTIVTVQKLK